LPDPPLSVVPATHFKWEPPPTDRFPLPHAVHLIRPRPSAALFSPTSQASASPAPATKVPPPHWTPSERHRRPPPSGERPSELLHSSIDRRLLTPWSPSSYRTPPHSSMTTGATPPPLNAAARHRLRRLTIGPPLWCAPTPSSLPGTPCAPLEISSRTLPPASRHRAVGERAPVTALRVASSAGRVWQAATPRGL
jgi:hypothetical protein